MHRLHIDEISEYYGKPYPFAFYPSAVQEQMIGNLEMAQDTSCVATQEASVLDVNGN